MGFPGKDNDCLIQITSVIFFVKVLSIPIWGEDVEEGDGGQAPLV
jgi:hypothetical protein